MAKVIGSVIFMLIILLFLEYYIKDFYFLSIIIALTRIQGAQSIHCLLSSWSGCHKPNSTILDA